LPQPNWIPGLSRAIEEQLLPAQSLCLQRSGLLAHKPSMQSQPPRVRTDDPASPWSAHNGFRSGLPAQTLLALTCKGEQEIIHLSTAHGHRAR
jgi:3-methylcrotonyl-CoA carboxylase alpha subunit